MNILKFLKGIKKIAGKNITKEKWDEVFDKTDINKNGNVSIMEAIFKIIDTVI